MRPFLSSYFDTLTNARREHIGSILDEAKLSKDDLGPVAERLAALNVVNSVLTRTESPMSHISAAVISSYMYELHLALTELYTMSNLTSLVLSNENSILSAEIQALEHELNSLEKMTENYAFLLADNGAYNFAFLEPFNDEIGRDTFNFNVTDRASQVFGPAEQASVLQTEGVLTLSQNPTSDIRLYGKILDTNAGSYVITNTGVDHATSSAYSTGWRYTVAAASPITTSIPGAEDATGAQVRVEFVLGSPSSISEIVFSPFAEQGVDLLKVLVFDSVDGQSDGVEMLSNPIKLTRPYTLKFPLRSVAKFEIIMSQPIYERSLQQVHSGEEHNRQVWDDIKGRSVPPQNEVLNHTIRIINDARRRRPHLIMGHGMYMWGFLNDKKGIMSSGFPRVPRWNTGGPSGDHSLAQMYSLDKDSFGQHWRRKRPLEKLFLQTAWKRHRDWMDPLMRRRVNESALYRTSADSGLANPGGSLIDPSIINNGINGNITPAMSMPTDTPSLGVFKGFTYHYTLGLQNISVGFDSATSRGVFVSKLMDAVGQISVVRLKVSDQNYTLNNTDRDSSIVTSIEYSVSNRARPDSESDWIPILPIGQDSVFAERFFPDVSGKGYFRFAANKQEPIFIYRNGYKFDFSIADSIIYSSDNQTVIGLKLQSNQYTAADFFTVDYTPIVEANTIDFTKHNIDDLPLVAAYDSDGAGEGFVSTFERNTIDLNNTPFIDYAQVDASTYSSTGLTPYQPIIVSLADGTTAVNLTNYRTDSSPVVLPDSTTDGYYYIHSGSTLIFNKPITQSCRVYYQFLENNVRVRVVLRVNYKDFVSPKVDFYHLKAKTRRPDAANSL